MVYQSLVVRFVLLIAVGLLGSCASVPPSELKPPQAGGSGLSITEPAPIPREFRAAWVATVANIDWPSKKDLTVAQQQAEMIAILDRASELKLNAVVLQIRTAADALYDSKLEPWSEYLTGEQGKAPEPYYDPLAMWVKEAHERSIELHAWFNPYRARHTSAASPSSPTHISNLKPHAVKSYGGFLWMDPAEEDASKQTLDVILDVVRRYDIDGVHIDDYFYPYPIPAPGSAAPAPSADDTPAPREELPFPDEPAWQRYLASGGKLERADWRRDNVNRLIEKIYTGIKAEKRWVKFGISPFGLGKPANRPPGIKGFSQYDKLYADAELWFQKGWLDYFTPQLYWPIGQEAQSYPVLLDNWIKENTMGRHLWPGMYLTRIQVAGSTARSWEPKEIVDQIVLTRERGKTNPLVAGHVHFSMIGMVQNRRGINDALKQSVYQNYAAVPASPWLAGELPTVTTGIRGGVGPKGTVEVRANFQHGADSEMFARFVVSVKRGDQWEHWPMAFAARNARAASLPLNFATDEKAPELVVFTPLDRAGNAGKAAIVTREMLRAVGSSAKEVGR